VFMCVTRQQNAGGGGPTDQCFMVSVADSILIQFWPGQSIDLEEAKD
jgi:hypothetical protein